jgi:hypothetical protein
MILPSTLDDMIPVVCNTGDSEILANARLSSLRNLPWLQMSEPRLDKVLIVGGGPSVRAFLPTIKALRESGAKVFAMNGTMKMLNDAGCGVDYFILLDARAESVKFLTDGTASEYLIASQCPPEAFDAVSPVTLWHPNYEGLTEIAGDRECVFIGGGCSVGLQSMSIAYAMGFREIHLYGFDSSYLDGAGHAYSQPQNDDDQPEEFIVGDKTFLAAPWMARQAMEFQTAAQQLADGDASVTVHGSGLLPEIARLMGQPQPETMNAVYDLSKSPASYDFTTWLVQAEMARKRHGFQKLSVSILPGPKNGFRDDTLPGSDEFKQQMLEKVMLPAVAMIGATVSDSKVGWSGDYRATPICEAVKRGEEMPYYKAPLWAVNLVKKHLGNRRPIVITLREATHWPARNSNLEAWLKFAKGKDVIFVRDTEKADEPLEGFETYPLASKHLEIRLALAELALVNMGISNGPLAFEFYSECPIVLFLRTSIEGYAPSNPEWFERNAGIRVGETFPWANLAQMIIWSEDSFDAITDAYDLFLETTQRALAG